ncbi:hypothetical protein [Stenotrophomonas sp. STK17_22]|uniref:hypothetical protein n=1 Tax=Stenotrophomonas sp. STK17_22 TaxID=3455201 RepID=UPI003F7DAC5E
MKISSMVSRILSGFRKADNAVDGQPHSDVFGSINQNAPSVHPRKSTLRAHRAVPAVKPSRSADYQVLAHPSLLDEVTHRKVLLCGDCVSITFDEATLRGSGEVGPTMISLAPRASARSVKALLGKATKPIHVGVDDRLLDRPRVRFAIAADGYLSWGIQHGRGTTVLLGGAEDGGTTYLDVFIFQERSLVEVWNRELPGHQEIGFPRLLDALVEMISDRYPHARVVAAGPLPDWEREGIEYLGMQPLRSLSFAPLSAKLSTTPGINYALGFAFTGAALYAGQVAFGWHSYTDAVDAYRVETTDPQLARAGGISNGMLEVLQQKRLFMEMPRPQEVLAARGRRIVSGVAAVPGVQIKSLTFHAGASGGDPGQFGAPAAPAPEAAASGDVGAAGAEDMAPDVSMELVVQRSSGFALEQAKLLMQQVGSRTGLSLRMASAAEDEGAGTRTFKLQGYIR